jgi:phage-related baseplate assembly protein
MTTIINVADLAKPEAIETLDYEAIVTRQKLIFAEYWDAVRTANPTLNLPSYDVAMLEFDPIVIDSQAESYRELLIRARVNDALRAVLPAFARGTDLDNIAARANVVRLVTARDEDGNPIEWESDAKLLDRYLAAFAAPAAGSEDGYIYQAATAWPQRHDIKVHNHSVEALNLDPGDVAVYLLAANGASVPDEVLLDVSRALGPKTTRPMTDVVSVRRATVVPWTLTAKLILRRGASPAAAVEQRRLAVRAFGDSRYHIDGLVTLPGAVSALWDPNVVNVEMTSPVADITHGPDKAPYLQAINLTYEVQG